MHGPQTAPIARGCQGQTGTLTEGLTVLGPRSRAEPVDRQNCRRVSSSGASSSKVERKACLFGSEEGGPSSENGQGLRFGPHDHEHAAICSPSKQIKACWKRGTSSLRVRMGKSNTAKAAPQACGTPVANRPSFGGAVPEAQFPSGHDGFRNRSHSPHSLFAGIKLRSPKSGRREKRTATSPIGGLVAVTRLERERGPEGEPGAVFSTPQCTRRRHHSKVNPPKRTRPADEGSGTTSIHSVPIRISSTCTEL